MQVFRHYSDIFLYLSWHYWLLGHKFSSPSRRISSLLLQCSEERIYLCFFQPLPSHTASIAACMWQAIIFFPSPCWEKFLNVVKNIEKRQKNLVIILLWIANHYLMMLEWWKLEYVLSLTPLPLLLTVDLIQILVLPLAKMQHCVVVWLYICQFMWCNFELCQKTVWSLVDLMLQIFTLRNSGFTREQLPN